MGAAQVMHSGTLQPIQTNIQSSIAQPLQANSSCESRRPSAKKGHQERQYALEEFVDAVRKVLTGESLCSRAAGSSCPSALRSVQRCVQDIKSDDSLHREDAEATLGAQLEYLEKRHRKDKGNPDFNTRKLFTSDELLFFTRALKLHAQMGWPMDYQQIRP
ncbi:MAG: hypothetical protein SGPRY_004937, partial [Prymnesium sp.]